MSIEYVCTQLLKDFNSDGYDSIEMRRHLA